ncbi:MAG: acyl-CoA dehydrogenase, partial [Pseudomonadota bacterium]
EDGVVMPDGARTAYERWAEAGWAALPCPEEFGGQNLPTLISTVCNEIWHSANMAFALGPLLTQGAVDALHAKGDDFMKSVILPKLVSGEWMGTMNLTEPTAGSDLNLLCTKAEPQGDGTYKITGTKIYISYGDHDLTENIVHLVLARLPDAPKGTRGISIFLVPKFHVNADGSLGARNDVYCTGVEEKLGIHASPTCTMTFGDNGGAVGHLIGEENKGLQIMFIMMNAARLGVAGEGVASAERAYQLSLAYANDRVQGSDVRDPDGGAVAIVHHPDVQRMLLRMKSLTEAARAISYATAGAMDVSRRASDAAEREEGARLTALLTPVAKAFGTDIGVEVSSLGIQVHGGMGYVEDAGAAQIFRDARIPPIYEGTNGIQAIDLVTRKLPEDDGRHVARYIASLRETADAVAASNAPAFGKTAENLRNAVDALETATTHLLETLPGEPAAALAGATPYLRLFGLAAGGAYLARGALNARTTDAHDSEATTALCRFFAANLIGETASLARVVTSGARALEAAAEKLLVA